MPVRHYAIGVPATRTYSTIKRAHDAAVAAADKIRGYVNFYVIPVETTEGNRYTAIFHAFSDIQDAVYIANMGFSTFH